MLLQTLKALFARTPEDTTETTQARVLRLLREKQPEQAKAALAPLVDREAPDPDVIALMGEVEFHLLHHSEAERMFLEALRLRPGLAPAHYGLSLIYYEANRIEDALMQAHFARNKAPDEARVLAQLGLCCIAVQDYGQARDVLRQAVLVDPQNVPALNNLGIALHAMQQPNDALYYFQRALAANPAYGPAQENLRTLFGIDSFASHFDSESNAIKTEIEGVETGKAEDHNDQDIAITDKLEAAFDESPEDETTATTLIKHYLKILNLEAARDILHIALAHSPKSVALLTQAGKVAHMLGQYKGAQSKFELALSHDPDHVPALLGLGKVLRDRDLHEEAIEPIEKAVRLQETPHTLIQLAFSLVNACRYEEALTTCARVEELKNEYAPFLASSRAVCHLYQGNFDDALRHIEEAQRSEPLNPSFTMFRGMLNLMHENYIEGWEGYRFRALGEAKHVRLLPYPLWQGEPLYGKTILVLAEQGLGDQVMFASCLPDLLALNPAQVILEAHQRVEKTLARSFPQVKVFPSGQHDFNWLPAELSPDYYVPLGDLPRHFRLEKSSFPNHQGYLTASLDRVTYWKQRLAGLNDKPKIGISWRGGLQQTRRTIRSMQLNQMGTLLANPRVQFVNLQYGPVQEELTDFSASQGIEIVNWPEAILDLDEFAALISSLDLVITVCNTTVHYSGALGRNCWVMAPFIPEWRYGLHSDRMRWYPSVSMYRQQTAGDWEHVLRKIAASLELQFPMGTE
ncbi:MAG: tetratricopeptide repeat protein [Pseudomonadota bacterium]